VSLLRSSSGSDSSNLSRHVSEHFALRFFLRDDQVPVFFPPSSWS